MSTSSRLHTMPSRMNELVYRKQQSKLNIHGSIKTRKNLNNSGTLPSIHKPIYEAINSGQYVAVDLHSNGTIPLKQILTSYLSRKKT